MALRWIPRACIAVFVAGIAGLIIASINGNNEGVVLSIGLVIVLAAVALLASNAVTTNRRIEVFEEAAGEKLERMIASLVAGGADEKKVRAVVRETARETRRLGQQ